MKRSASGTASARLDSERRKRYVAQSAFGVIALAALTAWSGAGDVLSMLRTVSLPWFGLALATYLTGQCLCAWKWARLASGLGFRQSCDRFARVYLGAMFPALFLPTAIGGDVFRVLWIARTARESGGGGGDRAGAAISVLADRGTGALALSIVATAAASAPGVSALPFRPIVIGVAAALLFAFLIPFAYRPRFPPASFAGRVLQFWEQPRLLWGAVLLALIFQALDCMAHWMIGRALRLEVPLAFYFILCPLASVAAMSPITLQGLGERSAVTVLLFSLVGVGAAPAMAFGLAWTAISVCSALVGGALLLTGGVIDLPGVKSDA